MRDQGYDPRAQQFLAMTATPDAMVPMPVNVAGLNQWEAAQAVRPKPRPGLHQRVISNSYKLSDINR